MVKSRPQKKETFDIFLILKYIVLTIVFGCLSYGIELIVTYACKQSPTGKCGNGILTLYEVHNTGAAFGILQDQSEVLIMAAILALIAIAICVVFLSGKMSSTASSALAVLSAGISVNLIERVSTGYVVDYISMDFLPDIPVFNTSDIMIIVGAICLVFSLFTRR